MSSDRAKTAFNSVATRTFKALSPVYILHTVVFTLQTDLYIENDLLSLQTHKQTLIYSKFLQVLVLNRLNHQPTHAS